MTSHVEQNADDRWFHWLRCVRHGGDAAYAAALDPLLHDIRDRLLDHAALQPGQHVADIGCGDGLAGFGALARQPTIRATFADISPALIAHVREVAAEHGMSERCDFVVGPAENLGLIPPATVDIVLVRAVLAYVSDRQAAVTEFRRILRPGGRISVVDPIFQDRAFAVAGLAAQLDAGECGPARMYLELLHRCRSGHFPDSLAAIRENPLTNYNERDLLRLFEAAGFANVALRLHVDSVPALPMPWDVYLNTSPYAGAPTILEILQRRFSRAERTTFERYFRPDVEAGMVLERNVNAYIFADNPSR